MRHLRTAAIAMTLSGAVGGIAVPSAQRSSKGHCDMVAALSLAAWHQRHVGARSNAVRAGGRGITADLAEPQLGGGAARPPIPVRRAGSRPDPDRPGHYVGGRGSWRDEQF
jgi:hypothetical protein